MKLLQSILFTLLLGSAATTHAVSQEVQVDLLMAKITAALKAEKPAEALPAFVELEGMEPSLQNPLPESFKFFYIDTLDKTGDKAKALKRAEAYLDKYGKNGKYYGQVIEIMSRLQGEVEKEAKARAAAEAEARRKAEAEAQARAAQAAAQAAAVAEEELRKNPKYVTQGGLTWMPVREIRYAYEQASSLCGGTINGQRGWRLPTKDELLSLYNSGAMKGLGWTLGDTWSSTPSGHGFHYGVYLLHGSYGSNNGLGDYYVSCVR